MLETEIKKLNSQIEQLNNNFAQFFTQVATVKVEPVQITAEEVEQATDDNQLELEQRAPEITKDSLRSLCLVKSRENKDNKAKIKTILKDLGATIVEDLSENGLGKANDKIGAL